MVMQSTDITIVGGGLVGLTTALALKNFPGTVTLVEAVTPQRQIQHDYDARSIALARGNQVFLQQLGVWPQIAAQATPILTIHVSDRGQFGKSRLTAQQEQVPALGYVIEIPALYNALLDAVAKVENLTHRCPASVSEIIRVKNGWELQFANESPQTNLPTKCVIAADGAKSSIRQMLNISSSEKDYQQHAIIANVSLREPHRGVAYERFTEQGPMALLPLSNQRAALIWTQPKEAASTIATLTDEDFLTALQRAFGFYAGEFTKVGKRVCYPLKSVWLKQQIEQHCVFIGNAAHTLHPIAGQGFNLSLQDIQSLTTALNDCGAIEQRVFEQYYKQRQPRQQRLMQLTDLMLATFTSPFSPVATIRSLALSALDYSRLPKHLFTRYMMGLK